MNEPKVFQGEDGQWYWHVVAPNGQRVAVGGEGFTREADARKAMRDARPRRPSPTMTVSLGHERRHDLVP